MNFITVEQRDALAALDDVRVPLAVRRETAADLVAALIDLLDDIDGDPDLEPSLGWMPGDNGLDLEGGDVQDEPHDDGEDDEPSLATPEPHYAGADYYLAKQSIYVSCQPLTSQASWGLGGSRAELEHEHDGAEPENEHGPSWAEAPARRGSLFSGSDEDHEPSLGLTEHINQATRTTEAPGWHFDDCEADYARDIGPTNRAMLADDEPDVTDREDDGIWMGERDDADFDSGQMIAGGNEQVAR